MERFEGNINQPTISYEELSFPSTSFEDGSHSRLLCVGSIKSKLNKQECCSISLFAFHFRDSTNNPLIHNSRYVYFFGNYKTDPQHRRQGIGQQTMSAVLDHVRQITSGTLPTDLFIVSTPDSHSILNRLGFTTVQPDSFYTFIEELIGQDPKGNIQQLPQSDKMVAERALMLLEYFEPDKDRLMQFSIQKS